MTSQTTLPDGWVWTTIGEIADAQSGVGFPKSFQGIPDSDYPLAKVSDISDSVRINNGTIYRANNYLSSADAKKIGAKVFPIGTTLFAKIGEAVRLNRRVINSVPILADNNVMGLIPNKDNVVPKYLYYYMHTVDLYEYSQATTVPSVRKSDIVQISFPLPPLPEQERIVAKIEELFTQLDAGTAALRRIQAGLKRYKASLLKAACEGRLVPQDPNDEPASELLRRLGKKPLEDPDLPELPSGWCWATIADIGANAKYAIVDGPFGSMLKVSDYVEDGEIPVLTISNIDDGFERERLRFINRQKFESVKRSAVHPGDILVAKIGASYGKVGYYPDWMPIGIIPANLLKISVHNLLEKGYVFYYLKNPDFKKRLDRITKSTAQPAFNVSMFRDLPIPLPPLMEQQRIVAELERLLSITSELEATIEANLERSARLRQSILQRAFEGRLV